MIRSKNTKIVLSKNTQAAESLWPCKHLGDKIRDQESKMCGNYFGKVAVHHCNLKDTECSRHKLYNRRRSHGVQHCLTCDQGPWSDML